MKRHTVKVTFADGNTIITGINGTPESIRQYYLGNQFNVGTCEDKLTKAINVEFL